MRGVMRRRLPAVVGSLLCASAIGLMSVPAAQATLSNATWTGGTSSSLWSNGLANGLNWSSSSVPASPLDVLSFPDLGACDSSIETCYTSTDDLGAVTANQLSVDNARSYDLEPADNSDTLTLLGNGGSPNVGLATVAPTGFLGVPYISIPITLGADQAWTVGGDVGGPSVQYITDVSGAHTLDLQLSGGAQLFAT